MNQTEIDSLNYGDAIIVWGEVPQCYRFVAAHPCGYGYICTKDISGAPIYCDLTEAAYILRVRESWVILDSHWKKFNSKQEAVDYANNVLELASRDSVNLQVFKISGE